MASPLELSDRDRQEALRMAVRIVASVTDDLTFPLAIGDSNTQYLVVIMAQMIIELSSGVEGPDRVRKHVFMTSVNGDVCQICNKPESSSFHDIDH